jgi:Tfp pilus assembly protein PilX
MRTPAKRRQRGATLVIALVMLILLTLLAVSSFTVGKGSLEVVGNMQARNQAIDAAQSAIEEAISNTHFFETPDAVFPVPCAGANTRCTDVNGDGVNDITVTLTPQPTCIEAHIIPMSDLNLSNPDDAGCTVGAPQNFGVAGTATSGNSLCADSVWRISAVATDAVTRAHATVTQGVAVRVRADNVAASCP